MTGLIVALDSPDLDASEGLARALEGRVSAFKVGLTLFTAHGPEAVRRIGAHGPVFCDLKLHDIPHQVELAAARLAALGVWMFTVHACGGRAMVAAAAAAAEGVEAPPLVAAVTVLTSLGPGDLTEMGVEDRPREQVARLARVAVGAGATALVCSVHEAAQLREAFGPATVLVTPGIRPPGTAAGDQARVATPGAAVAAGVSYVVVGRPITEAADPVASAEAMSAQLSG